jgi:broad specificity phosphatase PhoE
LICSPLRRTRETAAPIARALALPIESREEVSEVFDAALDTAARRAMLGPFLGGRWSEQTAELLAWRSRVLQTLLDLGPAQTIVVSHFVAISAAIGAATNDDRVSHAVPNASITTLDVVDGRLVLLREGDASHLG